MKRSNRWIGAAAGLILLPLFLLSDSATSVPALGLDSGGFGVGYRIIAGLDASRSFGPRHDGNGRPRTELLARPVKIHVWYPARPDGRSPATYAGYVWESAEARLSDSGTPEMHAAAEAEYMALPLRRKAKPDRLTRLLTSPTRAVRDAAPAPGRFPLVLYAPSINADPFENAVLFEHLASHGYVIAAAPCIGRDERETSRDYPGAAAQLGDLQYALARMVEEPNVDSERVGLLGFSWGGTNALWLALQHAGVDAVATLDAAAGFAEYRGIARALPSWSPQAMRAAFLEILPADEPREPAFGDKAKYADAFLWRVPGVRHSDFAADSQLKLRWAADDPAFDRTWAFFQLLAGRVTRFFDAFLKMNAATLQELKKGPTDPDGATWSFRPALPPPPTAAAFDRLIVDKGAAAAETLFRAVRASNPEAVIFDEARLLRYAVEWGPERADDLLILLRMQLEVYPDSAEGHFWMAQTHLAKEDRDRAELELRIVLKLNPEHGRARRLLESIRKKA